jgi:predicted deacylase
MQTREHRLIPQASGTQRHLISQHFGTEGARPKVVLQASLHADELPGMLTLHHLRALLTQAEAEGRLQGEVVLVPVANPIGLDQTVMHSQLGRFELATASNFNRDYPRFADWLTEPGHEVWPLLGPDAAANATTIRNALRAALERHPPVTELDSLRHTLMMLAHDADVALDLHCDFEAAVHLYLEPPCMDTLQPLAALLGARAVLVAEGSGGHCYDEALSGVWWQLAQRLRAQHGLDADQRPIPQGCTSTTVELRGQTDVTHPLAQTDAQALLAYLVHLGAVSGPAPTLPEPACQPTPLAGTQVLQAPHPGVLVYHRAPGDTLQPGDLVADIVEPMTGQTTSLHADVHGVLYARHIVRWATTGLEVGKVSGAVPRRTGPLLSA